MQATYTNCIAVLNETKPSQNGFVEWLREMYYRIRNPWPKKTSRRTFSAKDISRFEGMAKKDQSSFYHPSFYTGDK